MGKSRIPDPQEQPTITVPEAGALLGLGQSASYKAAHRGEIPFIQVGRALKVPTAKFNREVLGIAD
ncbi:MAG: excisionase family DNA-binding protein [Pseudonocardia sp.]